MKDGYWMGRRQESRQQFLLISVNFLSFAFFFSRASGRLRMIVVFRKWTLKSDNINKTTKNRSLAFILFIYLFYGSRTKIVLGSACRPSRQQFSVVFLRNSRKYGLGSLRKTPTEGIPPTGPGLTCGQLALFLQSTPSLDYFIHCFNILNYSQILSDIAFAFLSIFVAFLDSINAEEFRCVFRIK